MSSTTWDVFELRQKLNFLKSNSVCLRVRNRRPDVRGTMLMLAEDAGVSVNTLNDSIKSSRNRISDEAVVRLARCCGFGFDWKEWRDEFDGRGIYETRYDPARQDRSSDFEKRYLNAYRGAFVDGDGGHAHAPAETRPLNVVRVRNDELNARLASLWVSSHQGEPNVLHVELCCQAADVDPRLPRLHVVRGILEAHLGGMAITSLAAAEEMLVLYRSHQTSRSKVAIVLGGRRSSPSWEFQAAEPPIGLHAISPLCRLEEIVPGTELAFEFVVYGKHLSVDEVLRREPDLLDFEETAIARADQQPMGVAAQRLIEILVKKSVAPKSSGKLVLCRDVIQISERATS